MRDKALEGVVSLHMVGSKDRKPLRFERNLQLIFRDDHLVIRKRVGAINGGKEVHHLLLLGKFIQHPLAQRGWSPSPSGRAQGKTGKLTYLHRSQVGGHGLAGTVMPARGGAARPAGDEVAIRHNDKGIIGRNDDVIERLFRRCIVAGEPARRAIGLASHQRAGLGFFPTNLAPGGADGARATAIANNQLKLRPGGDIIGKAQAQLTRRLAELCHPRCALRGHAPGHHRPAQIQGQRR